MSLRDVIKSQIRERIEAVRPQLEVLQAELDEAQDLMALVDPASGGMSLPDVPEAGLPEPRLPMPHGHHLALPGAMSTTTRIHAVRALPGSPGANGAPGTLGALDSTRFPEMPVAVMPGLRSPEEQQRREGDAKVSSTATGKADCGECEAGRAGECVAGSGNTACGDSGTGSAGPSDLVGRALEHALAMLVAVDGVYAFRKPGQPPFRLDTDGTCSLLRAALGDHQQHRRQRDAGPCLGK
jgi:hypothetical protein